MRPEELRLVLRSLFLSAATPVRLAEIFGSLELAPGSGDASLPLRSRRVSVLALPNDDVTSLSFADDILRQLHPPAEVIVPAGAASFTGVERMRSHGIPVRTVAGMTAETGAAPEAEPGPAEWARLAEAAASPWTALWTTPRGPAYLADALCAAECSDADAVGPAVASWAGAAPPDAEAVDWAAADQDYVFVSAIRPDLARSELVRRGLQPGVWNRRGARLLALGPVRTGSGAATDHARTAPNVS